MKAIKKPNGTIKPKKSPKCLTRKPSKPLAIMRNGATQSRMNQTTIAVGHASSLTATSMFLRLHTMNGVPIVATPEMCLQSLSSLRA